MPNIAIMLEKYASLAATDVICNNARNALLRLYRNYTFPARKQSKLEKAVTAIDEASVILCGERGVIEKEIQNSRSVNF